MSRIPQQIKRPFAQDIAYLIGGGCVLTSFLYCVELLHIGDWPTFLFAAGVAYVVGYALHEWAAISHIIPTVPAHHPGMNLRRLYHRLTNEEWTEVNELDLSRAAEGLRTRLEGSDRAHFDCDGILSKMHLSMTMAPCCWVSAVFLLLRWFLGGRHLFDGVLTVAAVVFGFGFYYLGWLKDMQWTQQLACAARQEEEPQKQEPTPPARKTARRKAGTTPRRAERQQ